MDKSIEEVVNEQLNNEIWSSGVYMAFQLYFSEQGMPMLSSWLEIQVRKKGECIRRMSEYLLAGGGMVFLKGQVFRPETDWSQERHWKPSFLTSNIFIVR